MCKSYNESQVADQKKFKVLEEIAVQTDGLTDFSCQKNVLKNNKKENKLFIRKGNCNIHTRNDKKKKTTFFCMQIYDCDMQVCINVCYNHDIHTTILHVLTLYWVN